MKSPRRCCCAPMRSASFPMAERRGDDEIYWVDPERRGVLPLDDFHLPRRLAPHHPPGTASRSAAIPPSTASWRPAPSPISAGRETWINSPIERLSAQLFALGYAHSVECWHGGKLVGGLYGISLGGAFFGESMFSRERDASKVALAHLVLRLRLGGFRLLDTQFITSHLAQFGTIEISRGRLSPAPGRRHRRQGAVLRRGAAGRAGGILAVQHPEIVDRIVHGREGRAGGEHPAARRAAAASRPGRASTTSRKAALSGVSSGGACRRPGP